jgi:alpha-L-arabinofuranosidase
VDATAVLDEASGAVTLFTVNRDQRQPAALDIDLRACPGLAIGEHVALFDDDPDATNSAAEPERVTPRRLDEVKVADGHAGVVLPPLSWSMVRLRSAQ